MKHSLSFAFITVVVAGQGVAQDIAVKQLFHVSVPKLIFDTAVNEFGNELDIWKVSSTGPDIEADIYTTEETINQFHATANAKSERDAEDLPLIQIERDAVDTQELLRDSEATTAACAARTSRHLEEISNSTAKYTDSAFFDCWRTANEVYAFLDNLVVENADIFKSIDAVSSSIEGRPIPAYVLSTGPDKKAIYVQGLIHAREWHAGSTTFYTIAALLDGLRRNNSRIVSVVDKYDWYFVPIVNIDGYVFTHSPTGDRLWRKNRRPLKTSTGEAAFGVDLNRNFGPLKYFNKGNDSVTTETYPGTGPLSEPETAGIYAFIKTLPLAGALDIHAYSGLVLRPFGNKNESAPEPYGSKLKALGDNVKNAIQVYSDYRYVSETLSELYLAYGTFTDAVFSEFDNTPSLTFEMEGEGFVQPESVIRSGGQHIFLGVVQFAKELTAYYKGLA